MEILVDSNVILDICTEDPQWWDWSSRRLAQCADAGVLAINPIIYAEVSVGFEKAEDVDEVLPATIFRRDPLPWKAGFLAGKAFLAYRRNSGVRTTPLPDFYIGAHAATCGLTLLTRDPTRYRTYFPKLALIAPDQ